MQTILDCAYLSRDVYQMTPVTERLNAQEMHYVCDKHTDTQGMALVLEEKVYLVMRGTETVKLRMLFKNWGEFWTTLRSTILDWLTNVGVLKTDFYGIRVHRGFARAANSILTQVRDLLKKYPNHEFIVTGHSMGGALAVLIAVFIAKHAQAISKHRDISLVTFGQPKVSTKAQLQLALVACPYVRVQNGSDPVPLLPKGGYSHAGLNLYITERGKEPVLRDPSSFRKWLDRVGRYRKGIGRHFQDMYITKLEEYRESL